jgi:hypothetical protein
MIDLATYPVPSEQVVGRQLDGEAVVVLPEQGRVKVLNEVGARVWELADGSRTVAEIVAILAREYAADPGLIEQDVLVFLNQLVAAEGMTLQKEPVDRRA